MASVSRSSHLSDALASELTEKYNAALLGVAEAADDGKVDMGGLIDAFIGQTSNICKKATPCFKGSVEFVKISQSKISECLRLETHLNDEAQRTLLHRLNIKFVQIIIENFARYLNPVDLTHQEIATLLELVQKFDPSIEKSDLIDRVKACLTPQQKRQIVEISKELDTSLALSHIMVATRLKAAETIPQLKRKRIVLSLELDKINKDLQKIAELPDFTRLIVELVPAVQQAYLKGLSRSPEEIEKLRAEIDQEIEININLTSDQRALKDHVAKTLNRKMEFLGLFKG
jgi:hypothetical protein